MHHCTTTSGVGGENINSGKFPIRRGGVLQGDITSPLYFILTLELILRKYVRMMQYRTKVFHSWTSFCIYTLVYADDMALLEEGEVADVKRLSDRVTEISVGSRKDADTCLSQFQKQ